MIIVSDTSPLSNLFIIQKLDLLEKIFGQIVIPEAVMEELLELEKRSIDISVIKNASWIRVQKKFDQNEVTKLLNNLDLGEAQAIVLAEHLHAEWLLIDESKGRNIAKQRGIPIIGLLGILLQAKKQGLIASVKNVVDDLILIAKFRVKEDLYQKLLELAGE